MRYGSISAMELTTAVPSTTGAQRTYVVVLRARSNRLADLRPLIPLLLQALPALRPGEVKWVEA